jgi:hypothetical protein
LRHLEIHLRCDLGVASPYANRQQDQRQKRELSDKCSHDSPPTVPIFGESMARSG